MAKPDFYEIRVEGRLGTEWSGWFDGLTVTNLLGGETLLSGPVADQAALFGILVRIRDLGLPLVAVRRLDPGSRCSISLGGNGIERCTEPVKV